MSYLNRKNGVIAVSALTLIAAAAAAPAYAADGDAVSDLDQRVRILERQLEIQKEEADAKAKDAAIVTADSKGFSIRSADGEYSVELHGLVQGDARFYQQGQNSSTTNQFLLRRVEPTISGNLTRFVGFTITPEFGNSSATTPTNAVSGTTAGTPTVTANLLDYYLDLRFDPAATLRIGRFKEPVGLENLQATSAITFIERGLAIDLQPNRDIGAQLQGRVLHNTLSYAVGVFNGAADGGDAPISNPDTHFDIAARIFAEPFKNAPGLFQGLGIGLSGTRGSAGNNLPITTPASGSYYPSQIIASSSGSYVSTGQLKIFNYASGVTTAGLRTHFSPQAYWYYNRIGFLTEYVESTHSLSKGAVSDRLKNRAFQAQVSYLLTDDDASYTGVKPKHPFKLGRDGLGAFEVAARYGSLNIDSKAFSEGFATASKSVTKGAREYGVAFNWYLNNNAKLAINYEDSHFINAGATPATDRPNERALLLRAQINY